MFALQAGIFHSVADLYKWLSVRDSRFPLAIHVFLGFYIFLLVVFHFTDLEFLTLLKDFVLTIAIFFFFGGGNSTWV
jgi:hypothetical protein